MGKIESLKELHAKGLAVSKLPDSIGDLSKLVNLDLCHNQELECLPDTICNLRALEVRRISYCTKELPEELGKIESLKELHADGLAVLKSPDSICKMRSLTRLYLSHSKITALPSGISLLWNLEKLHLSGCGQLLSITELPPNLLYINAENCKSLERLNLFNFKLLEILVLTNCRALTEILGLGDLKSLKLMDLIGCPSSLSALALTEPLFQIYSGFEQVVNIRLEPKKFPDWIMQSMVQCSADLTKEISAWSSQSYMDEAEETLGGSSQSDDALKPEISASLNLQPNFSHNYLGMILCFQMLGYEQPDYSVMTSASNILQSGYQMLLHFYRTNIVIIPRSVFTVTDADHTIKFTSNAPRHWIHLLYRNEDDSTSVNVEDERNNPLASDLEVEEGGYPSKRLKLLELFV